MAPSAVPYVVRPFVGERFQPASRLMDYRLRAAQDEAEAIRQQGALSAQMWNGIGQGISGTLKDIATYPDVLRQRQMEALRLQQEQQQMADAAKAREILAAKEAAERARDAKVEQLRQQYQGQRIPREVISANFDPQFAEILNKSQENLFPTPAAPKTREVKTRNADGSESIAIVEDRPGQSWSSAAEVKPVETVTIETVDAKGNPVTRIIPKSEAVGQSFPKPSPREPQGPQPQWQWVVRDGKEVYTNRVKDGDKPQNARVKATEDERKTAGFYGQMSDAIGVIDALENQLTDKELYQIQSLPQEGLIGMANRGELSEAAKRYLRAFEQFTEARLRPVSGAAINDAEYARDRRTYARQFKETPKLAEDRRKARDRALEALRKRAGVALDEDVAGKPSKKNPFRDEQ
jgi:Spy/CpxP family protein refolding chaperone